MVIKFGQTDNETVSGEIGSQVALMPMVNQELIAEIGNSNRFRVI